MNLPTIPRRGGIFPAPLLIALATVACRTEVLQVAQREGTEESGDADELDCKSAPTTNELPSGGTFGASAESVDAQLRSRAYGAHEGPGLFLAARDSFRVYVNGALLAESDTARTPTFLPLTLLPGGTLIAVEVFAKSGAPALLAHLDELSRSYGTSTDWRVSFAPGEGWQAPGFDDSAWTHARDLGAPGALPGCDPTDLPATTEARWIGGVAGRSGSLAFRATLSVAPVGFGAAAVGGAGAPLTVVTTFEELAGVAAGDDPAIIALPEGLHDFRRTGADVEARMVCPQPCAAVPGKTVLHSDAGSCDATLVTAEFDERRLTIGSHKTLVGLGRGAQLRGVSLELGASEDVIVRNVTLFDVNAGVLEAGDAVNLSGARRIWLDHVTARDISDAHLDILSGSTEITLSHLHLSGTTKGDCDGRDRWLATLTDADATIYQSHFEGAATRSPAAAGPNARVHLFNNVVSDTTEWAVGSGCGAQVLMEANVFEGVPVISRISSCSDSTEPGRMSAADGENVYRDASVLFLGGAEAEPTDEVFTPPYAYGREPARDARAQVLARAGTGGPWALPLPTD